VKPKETVKPGCGYGGWTAGQFDPPGCGYGMGWAIGQFRGVRMIAHGGGVPGFCSELRRFPAQNLTIVVLSNQFPSNPGTDSWTISNELSELFLGPELAPLPKVAEPASLWVYGAVLAALLGAALLGFGAIRRLARLFAVGRA